MTRVNDAKRALILPLHKGAPVLASRAAAVSLGSVCVSQGLFLCWQVDRKWQDGALAAARLHPRPRRLQQDGVPGRRKTQSW